MISLLNFVPKKHTNRPAFVVYNEGINDWEGCPIDKLLIVDDEYSTRHGLKVCMEWEKYGIEVVGEAENGKKGLELVRLLQPDVILTDVKMPVMDGIEMSRQAKAIRPDAKIVFVSGYDDIDYLKSAMKMDAIDYILKPVDLTELENVIGKVMAISQREKSQKELLYRMSVKLNQSIPILREKLWIQLINDHGWDRQSLEKRMAFLELDLPYCASYCCLIVSIDNSRQVFESLSERETELISFSIQNICQESLDRQLSGCVFEHHRSEYVLAVRLPEPEGEETLYPLISELKANLHGFLKRFLDLSITIGVGMTVGSLGELADSYGMAREAVEQKLFLGKNQVITFDVLAAQTRIDFRQVNERAEALYSLLKTGELDRISRYLDELFRELGAARGVTLRDCRRIGLRLLLVASQFVSEFGIHSEELSEREPAVWEELSHMETLEDMNRCLQQYLAAVAASVEKQTTRKPHETIREIMRIVEDNYQTNLTIADIAAQVYLSKTYICLLFKQETGETINDYLTRVRMEKAKELLVGTDRKLAEVCFSIGYSEPSYFSKQFRKYTGLSPSEYREINHEGAG